MRVRHLAHILLGAVGLDQRAEPVPRDNELTATSVRTWSLNVVEAGLKSVSTKPDVRPWLAFAIERARR